jgi:hypothetical protein
MIASAHAAVVTLTFAGLQNNEQILNSTFRRS